MNFSSILKYFTPTHILDVGGHTGDFCKQAKYYFPRADFFIIEGNPICEQYIKELGIPYTIKIVGKEKKETIFYKTKKNPRSSGHSLYKEITPDYGDEFLIEEKVKQYTIDTIFEVANFDLIKIDTQGSELDILEGGQRICKQAKGILLEVSIEKYNEGAPLYNEVVDFMENFGFLEKDTLYEFYTTTEYGLKVHQKDILFVNKDCLKI